MKPIISIVIPTKDRCYYLKKTVRMILSYRLNSIEIIIQDNSDDNSEILDYLRLNPNEVIKYHYISEQMPISKNIDIGILQSCGEYVCVIGDDDGVLRNIVDCAKWMKENNIEALVPAKLIYNWPDYDKLAGMIEPGAMYHKPFMKQVHEVNALEQLRVLAATGFTDINNIPRVYQGIVKKECLNAVYDVGGTYCPGPSPDMANAVALSFVVEKFVSIDIPVVIIGQSMHVGGGERSLSGGVKKIEDVKFLPKNSAKIWDSRIPKVWCSQTVWPESAMKAITYMKRDSDVKINFELISARFISNHHDLYKMGYKISKNVFLLTLYLAVIENKKYARKIMDIIKKTIGRNIKLNTHEYKGLEDIMGASAALEKAQSDYLSEFNSILEEIH
jgi:glycosyltransferase involved in cell wall biosynthesis